MSATGPVSGRVAPSAISPAEFEWFASFLRGRSGIELKDGKQALVVSRLDRRLRHYGLVSFSDYIGLLSGGAFPEESTVAVDLLTTNETRFFREPQHFEKLAELVPDLSPATRPIRVWSAASSTGEEAYTCAITLAECLGHAPWEILGTDISSRVVRTASQGVYPIELASDIPPDLLRRYCRKGTGPYAGSFIFQAGIRRRVSFRQGNLMDPQPGAGLFDVVFLRNVLIYFSADTKREVLGNLLGRLRPGGILIVGHAESLSGLSDGLEPVVPSVFRLPAT